VNSCRLSLHIMPRVARDGQQRHQRTRSCTAPSFRCCSRGAASPVCLPDAGARRGKKGERRARGSRIEVLVVTGETTEGHGLSLSYRSPPGKLQIPFSAPVRPPTADRAAGVSRFQRVRSARPPAGIELGRSATVRLRNLNRRMLSSACFRAPFHLRYTPSGEERPGSRSVDGVPLGHPRARAPAGHRHRAGVVR
jgi:hypothetical protein